MTSARLLVKPPGGAQLLSAVTDTPSALEVGKAVPAAAKGWLSIPLQALGDSRPRLTLKYSDNSMQVINYRTLPAFDEHIDTYGKFQADTAFFTGPDPFRRSPSFMPWDRELNRTVLNDPRTFIVGLSDDAGAGMFEKTSACRLMVAPFSVPRIYVKHLAFVQQTLTQMYWERMGRCK